jgi:hypothetical protein
MHMLQWTAAVDDVDVAVPETGQREVERAGGCARTRDTAGKAARRHEAQRRTLRCPRRKSSSSF